MKLRSFFKSLSKKNQNCITYPDAAVLAFNPALSVTFVGVIIDLPAIQTVALKFKALSTLCAQVNVFVSELNFDSLEFALERILAELVVAPFGMSCLILS